MARFNLTKSKALAILGICQKLYQRNIDIGHASNAYAETHNGRLDQGFDIVLDRYFSKYPVMTDEEINNFLIELSK